MTHDDDDDDGNDSNATGSTTRKALRRQMEAGLTRCENGTNS